MMFRSSCSGSRKNRRSFAIRRYLPLILALTLMGLPSCRWARAFAVSKRADCLPNVTLTDQYGKPVSLASLKGKPVLVDFIYTSCASECLVMTSRMARIADRLGPEIGSKVTLVSITTDPGHDGPAQLLYYARHENANRPGWFFLTGTSTQIDAELADFHVTRRQYADGSIEHITEFFLLGPNGHARLVFDPMLVTPDDVAAHVEQVAAPG